MNLDAIYTPSVVADLVASYLPTGIQGNVLDPAAGEGALLSAVERKYGDNISPLAMDIDPVALSALREHAKWKVSQANVLVAHSRQQAAVWRAARAGLEAVVVNPPFSYRGNGGEWITYGSFAGLVSPAVAFLAVLLEKLEPKFGTWAILPDGALEADKHRDFWLQVDAIFDVTRLAQFGHGTFPGARVSTSLVRIVRRAGAAQPKPSAPLTNWPVPAYECCCIEVVRGRVPVHSLASREPSSTSTERGKFAMFMHSTNLGGAVSERRLAPGHLADYAPMAIIVRVGKWTSPLAVEAGTVVLSDCLIGLRPRTKRMLPTLLQTLDERADDFRKQFRGTGAKYITLDRICNVLREQGWRPVVTKASSPVSSCECRDIRRAERELAS